MTIEQISATEWLVDGVRVATQPGATAEQAAAVLAEALNPPPPSPEQAAAETQVAYTAAVDDRVTQTARARGYNGAESLASYVASTNPTWAAEAQAFVAWRDAVWTYALGVMAAVQAGEAALPALPDFLAAAPAIDWPE